MNKLEVDAKPVLNLFADLTGKQQRQSYKSALRKAANILSRETKKQLRSKIGSTINHRNWWNNKTLGSGIKVRVFKEGKESKVHIMGDFRLKFFEKGTKERVLEKRKKANGGQWKTGKMKAYYFFKKAKINKEKEIFSSMDSLLEQSIQRIANKYK